MNNKSKGLLNLFLVLNFFLIITSSLNAQKLIEEEGETSETIFERERYISVRRAGGPEKTLPKDAYTNAIIQKSKLVKDSEIQSSVTSGSSWVSVNPVGMFYNLTGSNYISGRTNSIAFHPSNPSIFYIAAAQGGVWKTTDAGANWTVLTDGLSSIASGAIAIDKNNPNVLYYGTGELNFSGDCQYGDGMFKSTDAGVTWNKIVPYSTCSHYSTIIVNPSNSNFVYAAGSSGIFKSTNAGSTWTKVNSTVNVTSLVMDFTVTANLYASTMNGSVYKTTNSGTNWTFYGALNGANAGRTQLAISDVNPQVLYASMENSSTGGLNALCKTTNGGVNWIVQNTTTNYLSSQGWYDNAVVVKPGDPNYVIVGGLDVYTSTNSGVTLTKVSGWSTSNTSNFTHADIHYFAYNGSTLYCLSDGGIYKSTNHGTSWTDLNAKISTLQYQSVDCSASNSFILHGGCQDNNKQTSTNSGLVWIQRATGDGGYTVVDNTNPIYVYGQYVNGSVQRSTNSGLTYTEISPSGAAQGGLFYNPYELAPGDNNTMVYGESDLWKTSNARTATQNSGWTQIATSTVLGGALSAIAISPFSTSKIYAANSGGRIIVTSNNGANWNSYTSGGNVTDLIVDNINDNVCYAVFGGTSSNRISKTTNGGISWTNISGNLPSIAVNTIALKTNGTRMIFVGTDVGVYQSTNEGASWVSFNTGMPSVQIYDLKYKSSLSLLLAATHGRGCFSFDLSGSILNNDVGTYINTYPSGATNLTNSPTLAPKAIVRNYGLVSQGTFNVSCVITGPTNYSSTKSSISLAQGGSYTITFDSSFTPAVGNYSMKVSTMLAGDQSTFNDTLTSFFTIINYNYGGGGTEAGGYYFANSVALFGVSNPPVYNWINPVTSGHTVATFSDPDDGSVTVNMGFNFTYMGSSYSSVNIYTNGFLNFGSVVSPYIYTLSSIPNVSNPVNMVAPGLIDLDFTSATYPSSKVYYGGDANKFVVTYYHAYPYINPGVSTNYITMQVVFYSSGNIRFQYNDIESLNYFTEFTPYCDIGIQNAAGNGGIQYRLNDVGGPMFSSPVALEFGLNPTALPVELESFTSLVNSNKVKLNWSTVSEQNNSGFDIERKKLTNDWNKIGNVTGNGTSNIIHNYSFEDKNLQSGKYNYRLKQIDFNGNFKYYELSNEVIIGIPDKFSLSQNYPNPFNPATTISFTVPNQDFVSLKVFDILGKELALLVSEIKAAGVYDITFDASKFASGVYFYKLETSSFSDVKRMVVTK